MNKTTIYSRFTISNDDLNCLFLLYMPLIGNDAVSLYLFWHSLLNRVTIKSESLDDETLLELLGWRLKKYEEAKTKLEGLNLIRSYKKDDDSIIILLAPMTPKNFLTDSNLGFYLSSKVGEDVYNHLVDRFRIPSIDLNGYQNVTKSFDEVFKTAIITNNTPINGNIIGRKPNKGSVVSNCDFDIDLFLSKIQKEFLPDGITEEFKKRILSIAYVYGFSIEQMVNLYNDAIDKNGNFDYDTFKRKSNSLFTYLTNNNGPELLIKNDANDNVAKFDNMTALELLTQIVGSNDYPSIYLRKIAELYEKVRLPRGVINVMIAYLYNEKQTIPALSYFLKVADSWQEKGIVNTSLAITYIESGSYPNEITNYGSIKRKKSNPDIQLEDWQKESIDNVLKGLDINAKD